MLFADAVPTATDSQLITVLLGGAGLTGIILLGLNLIEKVKTLFFPVPTPVPPVEDQYVTHRQFDQFKDEHKRSFEQLNNNIGAFKDECKRSSETTNSNIGAKYDHLMQNMSDLLVKLERLSAYQEIFEKLHKQHEEQ